MNLDSTSIVLIIILLGGFLYLINECNSNNAINNSGALESGNSGNSGNNVVDDEEDEDSVYDESESQEVESRDVDTQATESGSQAVTQTDEQTASQDSDSQLEEQDSVKPVKDKRKLKMVGRNNKLRKRVKYVSSSYKDGKRGGESDSSLDSFFENTVNDQDVQFNGNEINANDLASYVPGKKSQEKDDMYNAKELLPKESNKGWFDVYNNVKVKNTHLINVYRPIGANTVSGTLRNPTYDFRGDIPNPKYVVSPFLQSTIDPDTNNRGLCSV